VENRHIHEGYTVGMSLRKDDRVVQHISNARFSDGYLVVMPRADGNGKAMTTN
jgi:hypothetical protein